jgi:hypothetical protein
MTGKAQFGLVENEEAHDEELPLMLDHYHPLEVKFQAPSDFPQSNR